MSAPLVYKVQILVRSLDKRWIHFLPRLYMLQERLAHLGIIVVNDEVVYIENEEASHV